MSENQEFPRTTGFRTLQEVREYVDGDTIQCLECGRSFQRLTYKHLGTHAMTNEDYHLKYDIPWSYSLTSRKSRQKISEQFGPRNAVGLTRQRSRNSWANRRKRMPAVAHNWRINLRKGPRHPLGKLLQEQKRMQPPGEPTGAAHDCIWRPTDRIRPTRERP